MFVSRADDADRRDTGGISTVRAGTGADTLYVMDDGDRDSVDCGPGHDRFRFTSAGVTSPPFEDRYLRCPPVGIRIAATGTRSAGTAGVVVKSHNALPVRARLTLRSSTGRRLATRRLVLRRGTNRVRFSVRRTVPAGTVAGLVRSATGDVLAVRRQVTFPG